MLFIASTLLLSCVIVAVGVVAVEQRPTHEPHSLLASQVTLTIDSRLLLIGASSILCAAIYKLTYWYSRRRYDFFTKQFSYGERADWCSRTASSVHSGAIVIVILATVPYYSWTELLQTHENLDLLHSMMCASLGYFLYDMLLVVITLMDSWPLYVVHHTAASLPLVAVLFLGCERYSFLITAFFLVETTTVTVNFSFWLESFGMQERKRYRFCVHFSFWAWLIFRCLMPLALFWLMIDRMVFSGGKWGDILGRIAAFSGHETACAVTCTGCSLLIIAYCNLIFVKSMAPTYVKRLRKRWEKIQLAIKTHQEKRKLKKQQQQQHKSKSATPPPTGTPSSTGSGATKKRR